MTQPRLCAALLALLLTLSACGAPTAGPPPAPTLARLPSVTPIPSAGPPAPPQVIALATAPSRPPPPTVIPTATPGLVETADGPVTPSMARLRLAAEPYATLGDPNAPITVVEFADFGCVYCRQFHLRTFGALRAEYIDTGKVYYVYKDLPVTSRQGALAAQAAECGGAQGRYWALHDALFDAPEAWDGEDADALARIRAAAAEVGLDPVALEACVAQGDQLPNVDRNVAEAQRLQLYGTPAFLVNAKLLAGAQPIDIWREVLDRELAALAGR